MFALSLTFAALWAKLTDDKLAEKKLSLLFLENKGWDHFHEIILIIFALNQYPNC